jgi:hypothetical protein
MPTNKQKPTHGYCGLFHRSSMSVPATLDEKTRTITATVATEDPVMVYDNSRYEPIMEILLMSGAILPETKQVPLLDNHDRSMTTSVLGSARELTINTNRLDSNVHFSSTAEDAWTLAREGDLKDLSAGYQTYSSSSIVIDEGQTGVVDGREFINSYDMPLVIRRKWKLKEVSLTPIGADETTKFRNDQENINDRHDIPEQTNLTRETVSTVDTINFNTTILTGENKMPENTTQETRTETVQKIETNVDVNAITDAARKETEEAVTARTTEILDSCRSLSIDDDFARELIGNKKSIDEVRKMIIEKAKEKMTPVSVTVSVDEVDKTRGAMVDGLAYRAGYTFTTAEKQVIEKDNPYRGMSIHGLARHCLELSGERGVSMLDGPQLIDKGLSLSARQAQGVSDFPYVLGTTANKFFKGGWNETETSYDLWTGKGSLANFNKAELTKLSAIPDVSEIGEHEGVSLTAMSDSAEEAQLATFGTGYTISRKALINDNQNVFSTIPAKLSASMKRKIDRDVYAKLVANAVVKEDNKALFHTDHNNLAGTGAAPSVSTVAAARAALRKMKALSPKPGSPTIYTQGVAKYIIAGEDQWGLLAQIVGGSVDPAGNGQTLNPIQRLGLQIVTSPYIDQYAWYLATSPTDIGHITVYTLSGYETPTISSEPSHVGGPLGLSYQVIFDYAIGVDDYRGIYKNAGH